MRSRLALLLPTPTQRILAAAAAALFGALLSSPLSAQSWYRAAFQGPVNAATFENQSPSGTLKVGPFIFDISANLSFESSDNALLSSTPEAGSNIGFGLTFDASQQATKAQQLKLSGELTQRYVLSGPGRDLRYLTLAPGSALRYTVYIDEVRVMPFINLSRQVDPIDAPTVNNTDVFEQASYDGGLQLDWPLRQYVVQLLALRGFKSSDSDQQEKIEIDRSLLSARLLRTFSASFELGIDAFAVDQDYTNGPSRQSHIRTAGFFGRYTLTRTIRVKGAVGVNRVSYDEGSIATDQDRNTSLHAELEASHRVRANLNYTLRLARSVADGISSNFYESTDLTLAPTFTASERLTLRGDVGWQRVVESSAVGETGNRKNYGLQLEYTAKGKTTLRGGVRYLDKSSTLAPRSYTQLRFDLSLRKQF